MPTISVIIPAHNEERVIPDCLRACTADLPPEVVEVLVIDNASTDSTAAVARRFPRVRVVREPRKGLTRARQRGLREAKGELLAFFDADTLPPAGWIERIREEFADPGVVCLSGPIDYHDLPPASRTFQNAWNLHVCSAAYRMTGYMTIGGNFVARKSALERIGGFDTSIEFFGEDINIGRRLSEAGVVRFRPDYVARSSGRRLARQGVMLAGGLYLLGYFSETVLRRPLNWRYADVR